ncbi:hypothetical protein GOODEAATRI_025019 [Goodea atripinnis]|uniref:Cadherin domain-containing protein n=1 Tax=Goodea atripinnis TaxID=208336 RepID=A0ABV0PH74_9TELE
MQVLFLGLSLQLLLLIFRQSAGHDQNPHVIPQDALNFSFANSVYHATVYENSAARTYANSKIKMGIHLSKRSWEIRYRITSGDDEGLFKAEDYVLGDFCFLRIRTKGGNAAILNREIQDNYVLTVKAYVKGQALLETWTKVSIQVLDMNDLRPLFSPTTYSVTIAESTPLRTSIAQVTATDADIGSNGEFYFFFKDKMELFAVHPTSGVVYLSGKLNVNEQDQYDIEIMAVDRGMKLYGNNGVSSTAKLFVHIEHVNEHSPVMTIVTHSASRLDKNTFPTDIAVQEDLKVASSVFKVNAYDGDAGFNGQILYSISDGNTDNCFIIDLWTGLISVFLPMDREKRDRYILNLTIYDLGRPQKAAWRLLTVHIVDTNDNAPQFLQEGHRIVIPENTAIGTVIIQVEATDKDLGVNGEVVYSLLTSTTLFSINSTNGIVYVTGQLDRELVPFYNLKIKARDNPDKGRHKFSVTSLKVILEDVNDCPPLFIPSVYKARALEDIPLGTVVAWIETQDPDLGFGGQVRYSLINDHNGWFELDRNSGAIRLTKELDYEMQQFYNLTVKAKDKGKPVSLLSVSFVELEVIDVNENLYAPYFSHFALTGIVEENAPTGTTLLQVSAQDEDAGRDGEIHYSIRDGSGLGRFAIDEETELLSIEFSLVLSPLPSSF